MDPHQSSHRNRLWTPWRMRYIGGDAREDGCIFCNRLEGEDDVGSLILHRSEQAFVIMNLFPYNTGHVMVVPNQHAADLGQLDDASLADMAILLPKILSALRRVLACDGFNLGLNLGSVAGAGVADHLHQHVVPRWEGDANFMPILAGTMVIPEMIPASYAKIRAELERTLHGRNAFRIVVVSDQEGPRLWLRYGGIPTIEPGSDEPVWRSALHVVGTAGAEIVGWTGATRAMESGSPPGLLIRTERAPVGTGWRPIPWSPEAPELAALDAEAHDTIVRAERHRAAWVGAPGE